MSSHPHPQHPELAAIEWRDLTVLSRGQKLVNLLLSLPFLLLSWVSAWQGWWLIALIATFFFFSTALRQAHDTCHQNLGIGQRSNEIMRLYLTVTMLFSMHAIRHTHQIHHCQPFSEHDIEGNWASLPWYKAIFAGWLFTIAIQWQGLTQGNKHNRRRVALDMVLIAAVIVAALVTQHPILTYHVGVMIVGNMMLGFLTVWSVHHDCDEEVFARTERSPLLNFISANSFYHIEHHLYPRVPTHNLPKLAERLDAHAPRWTRQTVMPTGYVDRLDRLTPIGLKAGSTLIHKSQSSLT